MSDDTFEYITTDYLVQVDSEDTSEPTIEYIVELGEQGVPGIPGEKGEPGFSPTVGYILSNDTFKINIVNEDGVTQTPNLYDYLASKGDLNGYLKVDGSNADNLITINGIQLQGATGTGEGIRIYRGTSYNSIYSPSFTGGDDKDLEINYGLDGHLWFKNSLGYASLQYKGATLTLENNKLYYGGNSASNELATISDIPTVSDATITLTQGGVTKGTFTLNGSATTIDLDAGGSTITNPLAIGYTNGSVNYNLNLGVNETTSKVISSYTVNTEGSTLPPYIAPIKLLTGSSNPLVLTETQDGLYNLSLNIDSDTLEVNQDGELTVIGGGTTYTAGTGIDITSGVISVDNTVAMKTDIPDTTYMVTTNTAQTISGVKTFSSETHHTGVITFDSAMLNPIIRGMSGSSHRNMIYRMGNDSAIIVGNSNDTIDLKGSSTRPTYNSNNLALYSDIPTNSNYVDLTTDQTVGGTKTFSNDQKFGGYIYLDGSSNAQGVVHRVDNTRKGLVVRNNQFETVYVGNVYDALQLSGSGTRPTYYANSTSKNIAFTDDIPSLTGYATEVWVGQQGYLTSVSLADLTDVVITNPTQGQNLTYDAVNGKWINTSTTATVAWGGITGTLSDQTDLKNVLDNKQDLLTSENAGTDIAIAETYNEIVTTVNENNSITLTSAKANSLNYLKLYGGCEQNGTPTADQPIDIISNNGAIKVSPNLLNMNDLYGYYLLTDGGQVGSAAENFILTNFIRVFPNTTYTFSFISGTNAQYRRVCGYSSADQTTFTQLLIKKARPTTENEQFDLTFTTDANTNYIRISTCVVDTNAQVVEGSTAPTYRPYKQIYTDGTVETVTDNVGNVATCQMLLKIFNSIDTQEILSGTVTRNIDITVLDGSEGYTKSSTKNVFSSSAICPNITRVKSVMYCSHFVYDSGSTSDIPDGTIGTANTSTNVFIRNDNCTSVAEYQQWLKDQYTAGTPVIIVYQRQTETTETVTGQPMNVQAGDNTISITQASISTLPLEAEYIKLESAGIKISFNNDSGYITGITSSDVTNALGYTPYNSSNPNGYTSNVGTVTSVNNTQPDSSGNVTISIPSGGLQNTATGTDSLTILGSPTSESASINIGSSSTATRSNSIAIGNNANTVSQYSVAIGYNAKAGTSSDSSNGAVAIGYNAGGDYSKGNTVAIGNNAVAKSTGSIAIGDSAEVGNNNYTNGIAIGEGSQVYGANSINLGYGANVTANSFSVGFYGQNNNEPYILLDGTTGLIPEARIGTFTSSINSTAINPIVNKLTNADITVAPSSNINSEYLFTDMNNQSLGSFGSYRYSNGIQSIQMSAVNKISGTEKGAYLNVYVDSSGNDHCDASAGVKQSIAQMFVNFGTSYAISFDASGNFTPTTNGFLQVSVTSVGSGSIGYLTTAGLSTTIGHEINGYIATGTIPVQAGVVCHIDLFGGAYVSSATFIPNGRA